MKQDIRTTLMGCIVIIGTLFYAYFKKAWGDPLILSGLATGLGLISAKDSGK